MVANPSTIWTQLAAPLSPAGALPFVDLDQLSIDVDAANFFYAQLGISFAGSLQLYQLTVFGGLRVGYSNTVAVPGAATVNKTAGRSAIAAGQSVVVITSSYCFATSLVRVQLETADATLTRMIAVPAAGSFTLTGNAAATGIVTFSWEILNVY